MKTILNYLAMFSAITLLLVNFFAVIIPYSLVSQIILLIILAVWLKYHRQQITNLRLENFKEIKPYVEFIFLGSLGYMLVRQLLFSTGWVYQSALLASIFRMVQLPLVSLLISGMFIVVFSLPQQSIVETIDKKLSSKWVIAALIAMLLLGLALRAYKLGNSDIRGDEFQVIGAAAGHLNTGEYYRWNWIENRPTCLETTSGSCMYPRAWPHTWMISQTYKYLGISESTSRIPSVIFGTLFIGIGYLLAQYLSNSRTIGLFTALMIMGSTAYISLSRYTRMYMILLPIFALLVYFVLRAVHEKKVPEKLEKMLPYHLPFALISLVLLYFNYQIHVNSLVLLPALLIYIVIIALFTRSYRYVLPAILGVGGLIAGIWYIVSENFRFSGMISWFGSNNKIYLTHIYEYPLGIEILAIFSLLTLSSLVLYRKHFRNTLPWKKSLIIPVLLIFSTVFFIYFADRYAAFVYTSHLVVFAIVGSLIATWIMLQHLSKVSQIALLLSVLLIAMLPLLTTQAEKYHAQGEAKHSIAYEVIRENYNSETDVLLMQFPRDYYLQGLEDPNIVSMINNQRFQYDEFVQAASSSPRAWAAWESGKRYHLKSEIVNYIDQNFEKLHGAGVDDLKVEVYFCEDTSICMDGAEEFTLTSEPTAAPAIPVEEELEE